MSSFENEMRHEKHDEVHREREAGMYKHNDGLGGHSGVHHDEDRRHDDEEYEDDRHNDRPRRRSTHRGSDGIEAPTNVIYEAPTHVSHTNTHDTTGYQGSHRNPFGNLIMFLILIVIIVFGYMSITHTSFDQLIHMISGNHTILISAK